MDKLNAEEIDQICRLHPGWHFRGGELVRSYEFLDFGGAMAFVNRVAALAEAAGHHPDIDIRYNKVQLGLVTHDAGGISARDAAFITALSAQDVQIGEKK